MTVEREIGPDATTNRVYDGDGRLTAVDFDNLDYDLAWDPTRAVPQILEACVDDNLWARFVSGDERVGYQLVVDVPTDPATSTVGFGLYGYNVDGSVIPTDSTVTTAGGYDPFGNPYAPPNASFWLGYRGEAHIDGLIHLRNRDYDPATGTFTSVDPLDGTSGSPTQTNPYHYADNDPVNRVDPLGLSPCSRWPSTVLGFHIGTWACNNIDDIVGIGVGVGCGLAVTVGSGFTAAVVSGAVGGACAGAAQQIVNNLKTPGTGVLDDVLSADRLVDAAIGGAAGGLTYGAARGLGRLGGAGGGLGDDLARGSGVGDDIAGGAGDDLAGLPDMTLEPGQMGRKLGRHAMDWGLDPSNPADRQWIVNRIRDIRSNFDEVRVGAWHPGGGGGADYLFFQTRCRCGRDQGKWRVRYCPSGRSERWMV